MLLVWTWHATMILAVVEGPVQISVVWVVCGAKVHAFLSRSGFLVVAIAMCFCPASGCSLLPFLPGLCSLRLLCPYPAGLSAAS